MVGRKPKPTAQHKADGTYHATKHRDRRTFPALKDIPSPPPYFTKEQKEKWNLVCNLLKADGMLCEQFLELVERYCNAWQTWWQAAQEVKKKGLTFTAKSGQTKQNPAVAIEKEMLSLMLRILQDFGYTPRAAMSIKVPGGKKEEDPLAFLLNSEN